MVDAGVVGVDAELQAVANDAMLARNPKTTNIGRIGTSEPKRVTTSTKGYYGDARAAFTITRLGKASDLRMTAQELANPLPELTGAFAVDDAQLRGTRKACAVERFVDQRHRLVDAHAAYVDRAWRVACQRHV